MSGKLGPRIEIKCCGCKYLYSVDPGLWCDRLKRKWFFHGSYKTPNDCPYLRKRKLDKLNDL